MAVKIRLKRTGATNDVSYRVVAADKRSPRDGANLEILGWYDPSRAGESFKLKMDRIEEWIGKGAEVSDTVASLIRKARKAGTAETSAPAPAAAPAPAPAVEEEPETAVEDTTEADEKADAPATADAG
jgi:small subunit ribosomal protein S16